MNFERGCTKFTFVAYFFIIRRIFTELNLVSETMNSYLKCTCVRQQVKMFYHSDGQFSNLR